MSDFNYSDAFAGTERSKKDADAVRELTRLANDILRLVNMPNGDPLSTFHADLVRIMEQMRQLVGTPDVEKMIDWQRLIADVKADSPLGQTDEFWDAGKGQYKNPDGSINWMSALDEKQPAKKPAKKPEKPGSVGNLFNL